MAEIWPVKLKIVFTLLFSWNGEQEQELKEQEQEQQLEEQDQEQQLEKQEQELAEQFDLILCADCLFFEVISQ